MSGFIPIFIWLVIAVNLSLIGKFYNNSPIMAIGGTMLLLLAIFNEVS